MTWCRHRGSSPGGGGRERRWLEDCHSRCGREDQWRFCQRELAVGGSGRWPGPHTGRPVHRSCTSASLPLPTACSTHTQGGRSVLKSVSLSLSVPPVDVPGGEFVLALERGEVGGHGPALISLVMPHQMPPKMNLQSSSRQNGRNTRRGEDYKSRYTPVISAGKKSGLL